MPFIVDGFVHAWSLVRLHFEGHRGGKSSGVECVWKQVLTTTKKGHSNCTLDVRNLKKISKLSLLRHLGED